MSAVKRSWSASFESNGETQDRFVDDDDDEPSFGRQILPVARLPEDFHGEPVDGMQYLFMVRRDAKRLPNVTRVELPVHLQMRSPSRAVPGELSTADAMDNDIPGIPSSSAQKAERPIKMAPNLPSEEWRATFLTRFKNLRKNSVQKTIAMELPPETSSLLKQVPDRKHRDSWWLFIAGRPRREWDPPRSEKARKRAERRANVSGKPTRAVDDASRGSPSGLTGGVRLGANVSDTKGVESHLPMQFQPAYASSVVAWEVQSSERQEVLVYDENGDVVEQSATLDSVESIREVKELLDTSELPATDLRAELMLKDDTTSTPEPTSTQECVEQPGPPRQPTPSLLKRMDNTYCIHLLKYFTHWINLYVQQQSSTEIKTPVPATSSNYPHPSNPILTQTHARWIFSLLSRVDDDLSADDMSQLRMLARACIGFVKHERKDLYEKSKDVPQDRTDEADDMSVSDGSVEGFSDAKPTNPHVEVNEQYAPLSEGACWVIVTAIADFWAQKDLWMDAESLLCAQ